MSLCKDNIRDMFLLYMQKQCCARIQVTVLLKWLGCTADADPAVEFSSLAQFARAFDKAFAAVAKR